MIGITRVSVVVVLVMVLSVGTAGGRIVARGRLQGRDALVMARTDRRRRRCRGRSKASSGRRRQRGGRAVASA